ncbi:hypothetical protein QR680_010261 [Steinernema hermaphroditum]|uniref:Uncharacterized protein n=1 Tax=Steinernema hermaphroditum TaxID=289476 RepID=A0AA39MBE3_9BILA|nr:hypothetical protein QR680_010261 [Steinernema hermaphroditum]
MAILPLCVIFFTGWLFVDAYVVDRANLKSTDLEIINSSAPIDQLLDIQAYSTQGSRENISEEDRFFKTKVITIAIVVLLFVLLIFFAP